MSAGVLDEEPTSQQHKPLGRKTVLRAAYGLGRDPAIVMLIILVIGTSVIRPIFLSYGNLTNIPTQAAVLGIVTCGETLCLIGGTFDLSVGSTLSLVAVVIAKLMSSGVPTVVVILAALGVGAAVGVANGVLVGFLQANPVIVTLGTMSVYQGLAYLVSNGEYITLPNRPGFLAIGQKELFQIGMPAFLFLGVASLLQVALRMTRPGQWTYAVGSSAQASHVSGIRVSRVRFSLYVVAGVAAAVAAVANTARTGTATATDGITFEFQAITAAVIGGTSLFGGIGTIFRGALLGTAVLAVLANAQTLLGVSVDYQYVTEGVVVALIVALDYTRTKR